MRIVARLKISEYAGSASVLERFGQSAASKGANKGSAPEAANFARTLRRLKPKPASGRWHAEQERPSSPSGRKNGCCEMSTGPPGR
jgi:hypothetical protein